MDHPACGLATDEAFDLGGGRYVTHGRIKDVGGERVLNKSGSFHGEEGGGIGLGAHESSGARGNGGGGGGHHHGGGGGGSGGSGVGGGGGDGASGSGGGYDVGGGGGFTAGGVGGGAGWKLARSSLPGVGKVGAAPGLHRNWNSNHRLEDLPHLHAVHGGEELGSFKTAVPVGTSVHSSIGSFVHWFIRPLVHSSIGSLVHRFSRACVLRRVH